MKKIYVQDMVARWNSSL